MKKAHAINDLLVPLLGICGVGLLLSLTLNMWRDNEAALAAEQNGARQIACAEVVSQSELERHYLEIKQAKRGNSISFQSTENDRNTCAFLLLPDNVNDDNGVAFKHPVIVQGGSCITQQQAEQYCQNVELTGTIRNSDSLYFVHIESLTASYPNLDFQNAYVFAPGPPNGSASVTQHAIVFVIFMSMAILGCVVWLLFGIRQLIKSGITFKPEQDLTIPQASSPVIEWVDRSYVSVAAKPNAGINSEFANSDSVKPGKSRIILVKNLIVAMTIMLAIATCVVIYFRNVLPLGLDALGIFLTLGMLTASFLVTAKAVMHTDSYCRLNLQEHDLPRSSKRFFQRHENTLLNKGFRIGQSFRSNRAIKQYSKEYHSPNGQTVITLTHTCLAKAICCYTLLSSGQVIMTIDTPIMPLHHPLLSVTTGIKANLGSTYSIHRQLIAKFEDAVLAVEPAEAPSLWHYTTEIEAQATGNRPYSLPPIPRLSSVEEKFALTTETVEAF